MRKRFFVTGTDTEVGKTCISCALLTAAAERGLRTAAVKPVAAGCDDQGHNEDALALMQAMTESLSYQQVNPVALEPPLAPHIAAAQAGRNLRVSQLAGYCQGVTSGTADLVLIEGAGGWRVPLNSRETLADLAIALNAPAILVVGMRLGCINHAMLSAEAIARDGLTLAGWVANTPAQRMSCYDENLVALRERLGAPLLGEVPYLAPFCARQAGSQLDLDRLLG